MVANQPDRVERLAMSRRMALVALLVCGCLAAAGCGRRSGTGRRVATALPVSSAPIPGAPNVPLWLRTKIWRIAAGLGDPHPEKIAVTLNHREHGHVVDRVWMRGHFVCSTCVWTGTAHW